MRARLEVHVDYALLLIAMNCVLHDNLDTRKPAGYNTGHYQLFKHPHVMRSPPIGVEKLSGVFMNIFLNSILQYYLYKIPFLMLCLGFLDDFFFFLLF